MELVSLFMKRRTMELVCRLPSFAGWMRAGELVEGAAGVAIAGRVMGILAVGLLEMAQDRGGEHYLCSKGHWS